MMDRRPKKIRKDFVRIIFIDLETKMEKRVNSRSSSFFLRQADLFEKTITLKKVDG